MKTGWYSINTAPPVGSCLAAACMHVSTDKGLLMGVLFMSVNFTYFRCLNTSGQYDTIFLTIFSD